MAWPSCRGASDAPPGDGSEDDVYHGLSEAELSAFEAQVAALTTGVCSWGRGGDLTAVQTVGVVETMATPTRAWTVGPGAAVARLARTADLKAE